MSINELRSISKIERQRSLHTLLSNKCLHSFLLPIDIFPLNCNHDYLEHQSERWSLAFHVEMLSIELYLEQHRVIDIERRLLLLAAFITGENGDVVWYQKWINSIKHTYIFWYQNFALLWFFTTYIGPTHFEVTNVVITLSLELLYSYCLSSVYLFNHYFDQIMIKHWCFSHIQY